MEQPRALSALVKVVVWGSAAEAGTEGMVRKTRIPFWNRRAKHRLTVVVLRALWAARRGASLETSVLRGEVSWTIS